MRALTDPTYVIETEDLTKSFGDFTAVDGLTLKVKEGEIFGFLGPNGAGKTTAIRMMVGLLKPTEGGVTVLGSRTGADGGHVGICPQEIVLWEKLTPYENIYFMGKMFDVPSSILDQKVDRLLDELELVDKRESPTSELSGGMKRRLNLGMSLVHEPEIVVLDEPSAGLDPQSRYSLWDYINSLREDQDKTIILTTHLMEEAERLSDRVAIIDRGELLVLDTPEELKRSVGEGDTIKIELVNQEGSRDALAEMDSMDGVMETNLVEGKLVIRALDAVGKMGSFTGRLENAGYEISDVSVSRTNTLEDVFIHLTGRGLRT